MSVDRVAYDRAINVLKRCAPAWELSCEEIEETFQRVSDLSIDQFRHAIKILVLETRRFPDPKRLAPVIRYYASITHDP